MRKKTLLSTIAMLLAALPALPQVQLHRLSVNVRLASDYTLVTEVRDITPGGSEESFVSVDGRYLTKKPIMKISTGNSSYFEVKDWWNSQSPSQQKLGQCGRMWKDDIHARLYWGLYPGERKTYFVTYPLKDLLYSDSRHDVLDYDFANLSEQSPASTFEIKLYLDKGLKLSEGDIDLKGCRAEGDISLNDGTLTITPRKGSGPVTTFPVHLTFRNGLFPGLPLRSPEQSQTGKLMHNAISTNTIIPEEELHTPLMAEDTPVTEKAPFFLIEFINDYPKTCIFALCLVVIAICFAFRKIKAMLL